MCGIWTMISKSTHGFDNTDLTPLKSLMLLTSLRGEHSTGIISVTRDVIKKGYFYSTEKEVGNPFKLMEKKEFGTAVWPTATKIVYAIIGHGRHATKGEINTANAHPFTHKDVSLVHNGTLTGGVTIPKDGTDSEEICKMIAENSNLQTFVDKVTGAYALVWFNAKDLTINFLRNSQRPLYIMETVHNVYVASERETLNYIADKYFLNVTVKAMPIPTNTHLQFEIYTNKWAPETTLKAPLVQSYHTTSYGYNHINTWKAPVIVAKEWLNKRIFFRITNKMVSKKHVIFSGQTLYTAANPKVVPVFFRTTLANEGKFWNVARRVFTGTVCAIEATAGATEQSLSIRTRSIKHDPVQKTTPIPTAVEPLLLGNDEYEVEYVTTRDGTVLGLSLAEGLGQMGCDSCNDVITEEEIPLSTVVKSATGQTSLLCGVCQTIKDNQAAPHLTGVLH